MAGSGAVYPGVPARGCSRLRPAPAAPGSRLDLLTFALLQGQTGVVPLPTEAVAAAGEPAVIPTSLPSAGRGPLATASPPTLDAAQRDQVSAATAAFVLRGEAVFGRKFAPIAVVFDLSGRASGMYVVRGRERRIRYNPYVFARYFADNLAVTVPHEVAHYLCDRVYGFANIRPHGGEWRALMQAFGADARRTTNYDLDGLPQRVQRLHPYRCNCRTHQLSSRRHGKIRRQQAAYQCRHCGTALTSASP